MLLFFMITQTLSCSTYSCKPSSLDFTNSTCIYSSNTNVYLSSCPTSTYCPIVSSGNSSCSSIPSPVPQLSYPGESCSSSSDCLYGNCSNSICIANHWLESCDSTSECHVGLFCLNGTCWFQRDQYESCSEDTDCKNSMGCFKYNINEQGMCYPYYSLAVASWVYNCNNHFSQFCSSGNCGGPGGKGVCIDPIKPRYLSSLCDTDADCVGESYG